MIYVLYSTICFNCWTNIQLELESRGKGNWRTVERVATEAELLDDVLRDAGARAARLGRRPALSRRQQLVELLRVELLHNASVNMLKSGVQI